MSYQPMQNNGTIGDLNAAALVGVHASAEESGTTRIEHGDVVATFTLGAGQTKFPELVRDLPLPR